MIFDWRGARQADVTITVRERSRQKERRMSGDLQSALKKAEEKIGEEGEERGRNGAREDKGIIDEGDAAEDEPAEATGTDGSSDRRDADGDDSSGANASEDDGERKGKPDAKENLRTGHTHGFGGFQDCRVDTGESNVSVAEDRKEGVEDESNDGSALADAADEGNGYEEAEEGEARDRLKDAGDSERDGSQSGTLNDEHTERDTDEDRDCHGDDYEDDVIQCGAEDFAAMLQKKGPRTHAGAPGEIAREEVKARTSG